MNLLASSKDSIRIQGLIRVVEGYRVWGFVWAFTGLKGSEGVNLLLLDETLHHLKSLTQTHDS